MWPVVVIAVVVGLAGTFGWLISTRVIAANLPVSWDEGAHSLFGIAIARDIRSGDLLSLAYDTYRQVYWPPLHSWLTGLAFVAFGDRMSVSRDVSLGAYVLLPIALLVAGRVMIARDDRTGGWLAAGVAGLLAVALPALIPFASIAFLDLPALLAVVLTLLAAFWAERRPERTWRRLWIALGILAAFFLKTNYGVLLMVVFAIDALISPARLFSRRNMMVAIPVLAVLLVWFAYPPKLASTMRAMINTPAGASAWTIEGLLYYPRTLLTFAGSPAMLTIVLLGAALAWRDRRLPNVRVVFILAIVQFVLGEVHHTKEDRHILPLLPALILLVASTSARLAAEGRGGGWRIGVRRFGLTLGTAFLAVAGAQMWRVAHNPLPTWRTRLPDVPGVAHEAAIGAVRTAVERGDRVLLVGPFDLSPGPPVLDWDLVVDRRLLTIEHSGGIGVVDRDRIVAAGLRKGLVPSWIAGPLIRVLERSDVPAPLRTMYAGLPESLSSDAFARSMAETLTRGQIDVVIAATVVADSARFPRSYFERALSLPSLSHVSTSVAGDTVAVRVDEYRVAK